MDESKSVVCDIISKTGFENGKPHTLWEKSYRQRNKWKNDEDQKTDNLTLIINVGTAN